MFFQIDLFQKLLKQFGRMLKVRQSVIKKKLTLDPEMRFSSVILKENQFADNRVPSPLNSRHGQKHKEERPSQNQSRICNKLRPIIEDKQNKKLSEILSFNQLEVHKNTEKKPVQKGQKLQNNSISKLKTNSFSLPSLGNPRKKLETFNKIYYGAPEIKFEVIQELITALKNASFILQLSNSYEIKKENLDELLNYFMCLARTTDKKKVPLIITNFPNICQYEEISNKIFHKLKEKTYHKKRYDFRICSSEVNFQYISTTHDKKKNKGVKDRNVRTKTKLPEFEEVKVEEVVQTRKRTKTHNCMSSTVDFKSLQKSIKMPNFSEIKDITKTFKESIKKYEEFMLSSDFKEKICEFYPFESIQKKMLEQMNEYYSKTLHDPLLVPSLKEKLLKNLISKVISSFKFDVNIYSSSIEKKVKGINQSFQKINSFVAKEQEKAKKQFQMKKQLLLSCSKFDKELNETEQSIFDYLQNTKVEEDLVDPILHNLQEGRKFLQHFITEFMELNMNEKKEG